MNINALKRQVSRRIMRPIFEAVGNPRLSRPALHELDQKLEPYIDFDGGFFIEAGAFDGFKQSNTYYYERMRRWRGVLVEPVPTYYERCRNLRKNSSCFNCALVPFDYGKDKIIINQSDLFSIVDDSLGSPEESRSHALQAVEKGKMDNVQALEVPTRTLTSVLDEANAPKEIDLFTLDVEGFESAVLGGLDFNKYQPKLILVEVRDKLAIEKSLLGLYREEAVLYSGPSYSDILYRYTG